MKEPAVTRCTFTQDISSCGDVGKINNNEVVTSRYKERQYLKVISSVSCSSGDTTESKQQ